MDAGNKPSHEDAKKGISQAPANLHVAGKRGSREDAKVISQPPANLLVAGKKPSQEDAKTVMSQPPADLPVPEKRPCQEDAKTVISQPPAPPANLVAKAEKSPSPKKPNEGSGNPSLVPMLDDKAAPRPAPGQHTLTKAAIEQRARRIFTLRTNGQKKVSEHVWNEWHKGKGSKERANLESIFARCGYSHDRGPCIL